MNLTKNKFFLSLFGLILAIGLSACSMTPSAEIMDNEEISASEIAAEDKDVALIEDNTASDDYFYYNSIHYNIVHDNTADNEENHYADYEMPEDFARFFDAIHNIRQGLIINEKAFSFVTSWISSSEFAGITEYIAYFTEDGEPPYETFFAFLNNTEPNNIGGTLLMRNGEKPFMDADYEPLDKDGDTDIILYADNLSAEKLFSAVNDSPVVDSWEEWLDYLIEVMDEDEFFAVLVIEKNL